MAVPTRTEAVRLLLSLSPSPRLLAHVTVVAEVASFLALRAGQQGVALDRRLVEAAALLHDVDKALPVRHPLRALGHGTAGASWLAEHGHPELARAVERHPVMRLAEDGADEWLATAPLEERIVAYADKRATSRLRSLDERFARWTARHPDYAGSLTAAHARARQLETAVCGAAGIPPARVQRLRWVDGAIARAVDRGLVAAPVHPEEAEREDAEPERGRPAASVRS
jgi:putative nucleotidyltransferase with HDIG domain